MPNWIAARATEIRRAELERKTERDRQVAASIELKAKTKPFWNELTALLQQSVRDFNGEFSEAERQIDKFDVQASGVLLRRTSYPAVTVKANLNNAETSVQYSISRTHRKGIDPVETQAVLTYAVTDGTARYITDGVSTHEDVARIFLDPFFEF